MPNQDVQIAAKDGYPLAATVYTPDENSSGTVITINSAVAVHRRFYRHLASYLQGKGYTVVTYDYRGIGDSRPDSLRGFETKVEDWALLDMAAVLDWVIENHDPQKLVHLGHSYGGQTAGLLPNHDKIAAMVTFSSQSGYWKLQGGSQKYIVPLHLNITFPVLSAIYGYMPWSKIGSAEDLPKGVALGWARWCRHPEYLRGDKSLPLERYQDFDAPVLAFSFDDDNWGTARSVDDMMRAYPNVERRHVKPDDINMKTIGHFGAFRPQAEMLWDEILTWVETQTQ